MEEISTLAVRLFDLDIKFRMVEAEVGELLEKIYGEDGYEDFSHDYYDCSIEVYGVTPTPEAAQALHDAGFNYVWQHNHKMGTPSKIECGCKLQVSRATRAAIEAAKAKAP